jgi:hypothetical protein
MQFFVYRGGGDGAASQSGVEGVGCRKMAIWTFGESPQGAASRDACEGY